MDNHCHGVVDDNRKGRFSKKDYLVEHLYGAKI